jgi:pimeloyl-ACP methyl ester carboxylesterase
MDFRGTGASDAPDGSYSTRGFAEDVVAVLDALDVDRADVYGTSMGGRVAQWLAACHPGRVRHLIWAAHRRAGNTQSSHRPRSGEHWPARMRSTLWPT